MTHGQPLPRLVVWQVWRHNHDDQFFASQAEAESYIHRRYGEMRLHPDDVWHAWTRENYGGVGYHPDGEALWIGWNRHAAVHLERHEIDATERGIVRALNELPRHRRHQSVGGANSR